MSFMSSANNNNSAQATWEPSHGGLQSSMFLCLSQARINWDGCSRKGIWHKNEGMMELGR